MGMKRTKDKRRALVVRNGRPAISKLDTWQIDPINLVYQLALLGATDEQMAKAMGIAVSSLNNWKVSRPDFMEAMKAGKDQADSEIAKSLFHRARGYSHPEVHIAVIKDRETGQIEVVQTPTIKHYPPDTTACIFWLKNRQKTLWRDVHRAEVTGPDGAPIQSEIKRHKLDLKTLSDEELALAETLGLPIIAGMKKPEEKTT